MLIKYFPLDQQKRFFPSAPPKKPFTGECFVDFDKFEKALTEKYGKPENQDVRFSKEIDIDNDKRSDLEDLEFMEDEIRNNKGFWATTWKIRETEISLILHGESGKMQFEIAYSSIKLGGLEKEAPL
jgi:helix-turn-helix protein